MVIASTWANRSSCFKEEPFQGKGSLKGHAAQLTALSEGCTGAQPGANDPGETIEVWDLIFCHCIWLLKAFPQLSSSGIAWKGSLAVASIQGSGLRWA